MSDTRKILECLAVAGGERLSNLHHGHDGHLLQLVTCTPPLVGVHEDFVFVTEAGHDALRFGGIE